MQELLRFSRWEQNAIAINERLASSQPRVMKRHIYIRYFTLFVDTRPVQGCNKFFRLKKIGTVVGCSLVGEILAEELPTT